MLEALPITLICQKNKREGETKEKSILQNIDNVNGHETSNSKWESEIVAISYFLMFL